MKKIITITVFSILSYFNTQAQLTHYQSLNTLNYCASKIQNILESQGKVKGKVKKITYSEGYTLLELNYDSDGKLLNAAYKDPTTRQENEFIYDEEGIIKIEKTPCISFNGETFEKTDSMLLYFRKFNKASDTSSYWSVIRKYGKKIALASIDHIQPKKSFREITTFTCNQNTTFLFEDTSILRKADDIEWGRKMIQEDELIGYQKIKWFYDEKNKPIRLEELRLTQGDIHPKPLVYDLKYETETKGTLVGGKEPYYKFFINRFGEAIAIKNFEAKTDEKYTNDKEGNWIIHTYNTIRKGKILEITENRKIEYWEN